MARTELLERSRQRSVPLALLVLAGILLAARIALWLSAEAQPAGKVNWVPVEQASLVARQTGKPIMYDFTAEWCPPCHALEREVFSVDEYAAEINRRFVPVRVVDRTREEGRNKPAVVKAQLRYRVNAFPTVVFSGPDGAELGRMEGFRNAKHFQRVMDSIR